MTTHEATIFDISSAQRNEYVEQIACILENMLSEQSLHSQVESLNAVRLVLHSFSPFQDEPVDCVQWVSLDEVEANDYNPNSVAPPEMELLKHSIDADGYTQPIVAWKRDNTYEVVDGFHRNRVGREYKSVAERIKGYLPLVIIKNSREERGDRIAATIRHNRARGKHRIDAMSDIVVELKKRNWSDDRIGKELGMDSDEVLRLTQISGLAEMFAHEEFSEAWEPDEGDMPDASYHDADGEETDLEWYSRALIHEGPLGWEDRTDKQSVLYGNTPKVRGTINKSHVAEHWHWYAFTVPMTSGIADTREIAKDAVESAWGKSDETNIPSLFPLGRIYSRNVAQDSDC